jgi:hypothetical protein
MGYVDPLEKQVGHNSTFSSSSDPTSIGSLFSSANLTEWSQEVVLGLQALQLLNDQTLADLQKNLGVLTKV